MPQEIFMFSDINTGLAIQISVSLIDTICLLNLGLVEILRGHITIWVGHS